MHCKLNSKVEVECFHDGRFEHEVNNWGQADIEANYPKCIWGCIDFPSFDGLRPLSKLPMLPNTTIDYICEVSNVWTSNDLSI